ncbi:DUF6950 family protein [Sphingomonas sp. SRS2]|uniref:DUF6950 family protein n=1 Tax=Sphingomonas sp. SRS2 TaxID=133190 RepID=UPI0006184B59|nr:hypothetical protein [Sphingomonas sp. SRS2]KKC24936.1 hypothetical protein WP12_17105 [Sphingomonas sp. SRS2]
MTRHHDWETRLGAYLRECRDVPFAWGKHDCCTFVGGAVLAMTGVDHIAAFRGHYRTARGAARALRRFGRGTLVKTVTSKAKPIKVALAQRGDVVLVDDGQGGEAVAIVLGAFAVGVGAHGDQEGLIKIERAAWRRAWRVN